MLLTITNLSSTAPVYISSCYKQLDASGSITVRRAMAQVDADVGLKALVTAGNVSLSFAEEAGDDLTTLGGLEAGAATTLTLFKTFTAGAGGAADDVVIYAANAPFAFDIIDVTAVVTTLVSGSNLQLRSAAAGAGSTLSDALTAATTGTKRNTTAAAIPAVAAGGSLIIRRSDSGIAGTVFATILRKS